MQNTNEAIKAEREKVKELKAKNKESKNTFISQSFSKTVGFISLGCDKNRVDTENIISTLKTHSCFNFVYDSSQAQIIIINTCAFLHSARVEAREIIEEMGKLKLTGKLEKLIVAGCLPLLEKEKVLKDFKCVDSVIVPDEYSKIDEIVFSLFGEKPKKADLKLDYRMTTTPSHYAYLK